MQLFFILNISILVFTFYSLVAIFLRVMLVVYNNVYVGLQINDVEKRERERGIK